MSLRFRRSIKLMPGVRFNINKNSTSFTFGPRGAHYTISSTGRHTATAGLPGTGLYDQTVVRSASSSGDTRAERWARTGDPNGGTDLGPIPEPRFFSSKLEKDFNLLYLRIADGSLTEDQFFIDSKELLAQHPELTPPLKLLAFLYGIRKDKTSKEALTWGEEIFSNLDGFFSNKIVKKYFGHLVLTIPIVKKIDSQMVFDKQAFIYMYIEALQVDGQLDAAYEKLESLEPNQLNAISMADLEIAMKDYDGAIDTTEDIENEDDYTALLLVLRGIAFREQGVPDAALECFKRALAKKGRFDQVIHKARWERAATYLQEGKKALARKDVAAILADEPNYEGAREFLEAHK